MQIVWGRNWEGGDASLSDHPEHIALYSFRQDIDGGWLTEERLRLLIGNILSTDSGALDARVSALAELGNSVKQQIGLLAISDGFVLIALCAALCLLVMSFLTYVPPLVPALKKSE